MKGVRGLTRNTMTDHMGALFFLSHLNITEAPIWVPMRTSRDVEADIARKGCSQIYVLKAEEDQRPIALIESFESPS